MPGVISHLTIANKIIKKLPLETIKRVDLFYCCYKT